MRHSSIHFLFLLLSLALPREEALSGETAPKDFGRAVAPAGDLDGDGVPDVAVGGGFVWLGGGRVRILSGKDGHLLREVQAEHAEDWFGFSLALAGDVDGDGKPDLLVGVPRFTFEGHGPPGVRRPGRAVVLSGKDGSRIRTLDGLESEAEAGYSVAASGDVDGDKVPDLVVGAPKARQSGLEEEAPGLVRMFSGKTGKPLWARWGDVPGGKLGLSLAGVGDVNGDGIPDVAAGAPKAGPSASSRPGCVLLFSGKDGTVLLSIAGTGEVAGFGASVAAAGDLDGDGIADVWVGAPGWLPAGKKAWVEGDRLPSGRVVAISGKKGTPILTIEGKGALGQFGASLAGGSDLNGDGVPDLAVGAPSASSGPRPGDGVVWLHSGKDGSEVRRIPGGTAGHDFGCSVAIVGDTDKDGVPDLLAGADQPGGEKFGGPGWVRLLSGKDGHALWTVTGADGPK
jgi:hypothetical protein